MRMGLISVTILALLSISTIASADRIRDLEAVSSDTHVVYGTIDLFDRDKLKRNTRSVLVILPEHTSETLNYRATRNEDGVFFLGLEPGNYTLLSYVWSSSMTADFFGVDIRRDFNVPQSGGDIYIGTIEARKNKNKLEVRIHDEFDRVSKIYDTRFPERQGASVNRALEESEQIGSFRSKSYQCLPEWNIECDHGFQGVTPITPIVKKAPGLWPETESLTPGFSWVPESADTSYDLIVYEAAFVNLTYGPGYIPGHLVAYVEGLTEAYWQPETPLKPDTRYFWSVRLRQGDAVSWWSTKSFFMFAVIAMAASSGDWFQFRTP